MAVKPSASPGRVSRVEVVPNYSELRPGILACQFGTVPNSGRQERKVLAHELGTRSLLARCRTR